MKSENLTDSIYKNYNELEKTHERNSDFDKTDNVFEEDGTPNESDVLQTQSGNVHKNFIQEESGNSSQLLEKDKALEEDKINTSAVSDFPKNTENPQEIRNANTIAKTGKNGRNDVVAGETRSENSLETDKKENVKDDVGLANSSHDKVKHDSEQKRVNSRKGDTGVQLFLNVSNFGSDETDGETSRVSSRHIVEPVDERVTIEVLQPKSDQDREMSKKETGQVRYNAPKMIDEDSHSNVSFWV